MSLYSRSLGNPHPCEGFLITSKGVLLQCVHSGNLTEGPLFLLDSSGWLDLCTLLNLLHTCKLGPVFHCVASLLFSLSLSLSLSLSPSPSLLPSLPFPFTFSFSPLPFLLEWPQQSATTVCIGATCGPPHPLELSSYHTTNS